MNVRRAVEIFSPPVTAALTFLQDQAGHTCDISFASASLTIEFMETMYKWFQVNDVSNCTQHIHQRQPNVRHYDDPDDDRLTWLEEGFLDYLKRLQLSSGSPKYFLSAETYEAVTLTSKATAQFTRHLLKKRKFCFVLTRRLSSDPIESLFGMLRQAAGSNDKQDARSVVFAMVKMLKTGLITSTCGSNVNSEEIVPLSSLFPKQGSSSKSKKSKNDDELELKLPAKVMSILDGFQDLPFLPTTVDNAATALVAGYLSRVVEEHIECIECVELVQRPATQLPIQGLIRNLDRGGLRYPTLNFVAVVHVMQNFTEKALGHLPANTKVRMSITHCMKPKMMKCKALHCANSRRDEKHVDELCDILCYKFLRPLLLNFANTITDSNDTSKKLQRKPLSRKVLRL